MTKTVVVAQVTDERVIAGRAPPPRTVYTVQKLVNVTKPRIGEELLERDVQSLISKKINVTVVGGGRRVSA